MNLKTIKILTLVLCFGIIFYCGASLVYTGTKHVMRAKEKAERQEELSKMYSYEVYSSYIAQNEEYKTFLMCNPKYDLNDVIVEKLSDEYLESLKNKIDDAEKPKLPTRIYMMIPSEELPYGWESSELNISMNFDTSIFHRQTECIIIVPYGATSLNECSFNYRNADGAWEIRLY